MIDDKKRELLQKLYALAERGDRGERAAARHQLDKLLQKYNIDEAELADDIVKEYEFHYSGKRQKALLIQLYAKIATNRECYRYTRGRGKNSISICKCTKAEALQIQIEFEFYNQLWEEEVELFFSAFIQKHRIFDDSPGHSTTEIDDKTFLRMAAMMRGLQDKSPLKMIEGG